MMQKKDDLESKRNSHPFHEDLAILLDIYQEGDTIEALVGRIEESSASPATKTHSLKWVATEVLKPQVLDTHAARALKKSGACLPVKQFREMLDCMAILADDVLRCFMTKVVWNLKNNGVDAVYARQVLEFSERYLSGGYSSGYISKKNVRTEPVSKEEIIYLTKYIIKTLIARKVLKTSKIHQNSKVLIFSFEELNLCDATIVFLMYWMKELNYSIIDTVENESWHVFGLNKPKLISRLKKSPLDNFFHIGDVWDFNLTYKHNSSVDAINRLRLMNI